MAHLSPPRSTAERVVEAPAISFTRDELVNLEKAATNDEVFVGARDSNFVPLMQALKENPLIRRLDMGVSPYMSGSQVRLLAELVATSATIKKLVFLRDAGDSTPITFEQAASDDDFTLLIEAIAASSSLKCIGITGQFPTEWCAANAEALRRRKATCTTLRLWVCGLTYIMENPSHFDEWLATDKGLKCLQRGNTDGDDKILRDAIRNSQSLKEVKAGVGISGRKRLRHVLEGLDGNESMEVLHVCVPLDPIEASLLNKVITNHEKLASLSITDCALTDPDEFASFCDAVSRSPSITRFTCILKGHHINTGQFRPYISSLSWMLQQSTSLRELNLPCEYYAEGIKDELAAGIKGCESLTTLKVRKYCHLKVIQGLIDVVIAKPNLTTIDFTNHDKDKIAKSHKEELDFFLNMNKHGRSLGDMPVCAWPYALEKAGRFKHLEALYFLLRQTPHVFKPTPH